MRIPVGWLSDYVALPPGTTGGQVADALLGVGFETEDVHVVPPTTGDLVVGRVLAVEELTGFKKPIRFCQVDVGPGHGPDGGDGPRGIVCGARNFAAGDTVVVALPGAVLPGDFAIASRSTYGHVSDGMICSARELGVGTDHDGILVLAPGAPEQAASAAPRPGTDARPLIGADDAVVEIAVNPDRGYALALRGLARETAIALDLPFTDPIDAVAPPRREAPGRAVRIEDPRGCARFVTVLIRGVDPAAPSPYRLRQRVQAAGMRSISLAVDVTNYLMLAYGQPLHAFDADRLTGDVVVRRARAGETLTTLDGVDRRLDPDDLVVADDTGPVSLAGVMGGRSTEIGDTTTDVVIEAAWWDPAVVSRMARRHKLPSEASRRFERGVDPAIAAAVAEEAARLLVEHGGGRVVGRTDVGGYAAAAPIALPLAEPERLVGRPYAPVVISSRLRQLGCTVQDAADAAADPAAAAAASEGPAGSRGSDGTAPTGAVAVTPPTWRPDLTRPADLVEEVARLEGYDTIPSVLPAAPAGTGRTSRQTRELRVAADLVSAGLTEVLPFPFVGTAELDALGLAPDDTRRRAVTLANPLDAERPDLATTLLPGVLDTAVRNLSRGSRDLALFQIGQVFLPGTNAPRPPTLPVDRAPSEADFTLLEASLPAQPRHVAAVLVGAAERPGWWGPGRPAGWADALQLARRVARTAGVELRVTAAEQAPFHPGRCARLSVGDWPVGHAGELHPAVGERLGLPARSAAFELDLDLLPDPEPVRGVLVSPFPPVHLDLALVVTADVPAGDVHEALVAGGGELLESVRLFDVYTGDRVAAGTKSLAFALVVRSPERTLTAAEAVDVRDAALAEAARRYGAGLRD